MSTNLKKRSAKTKPMVATRRRKPVTAQGVSIRAAIIDAMKRNKRSKYFIWKASGVPRTVIYEFLRGTGGRDISLRHAENLLGVCGVRLVVGDEPKGKAKENGKQ